MRSKLVFLFPLLALLVSASLQAQAPPSRSPVLLAEINLNGDVRLLLTLYNDGEAILARKDADEPDGEICSAIVPADYLEAFESTFREAGALHLQDAEPIPNVSRKTISFFIGPDKPGRTHGNTFSYYRAEGPYLPIARALSAVIDDHFRGCI